MKLRGVDPMIWSGAYGMYTTEMLAGLRTNFEGEEAELIMTFDGTASKLIDTIGADGTIKYKDPVTITEENGYELYGSAGVYYALDFLSNIVSNGYYAAASMNESVTHSGAQSTYITSKYNSNTSPIAMLVEGTWWPHEASATFQQLESRYPNASLADRRFAIMPYPKATADQVGEQNTIVTSTAETLACINGKIDKEKIELATTFLQFCHTDESLKEFLQTTNISRAYDFELSEEEYNSLNTFSKSYYDIVNSSRLVANSGKSEFFYRNYSALGELVAFESSYGTNPVTAFKAKVSTKDVFNAIKTKYNATTWKVLMH